MKLSHKTINVYVPEGLKTICHSVASRKTGLDYSINPVTWTSASSAPAFDAADLHVVFIDSADWMSDALTTAITNTLDKQPPSCPVQRLLLFGFMDEPEADIGVSTAICNKPLLLFLFKAFPVNYGRLPLSLSDIRKAIIDVAFGQSLETWERDWKRVDCAIQTRLKKDSALSRRQVWDCFESLADADLRAREVHDVGKGTDGRGYDIAKIEAFQEEIDCYYLATARDCRTEREFIVIEDHPKAVREDLQMLADATGHAFFVTRKQDELESVHDVIRYIESSSFNGKFLAKQFDRLSGDSAGVTTTANAEHEIEPSAILVDLQLGKDGDREISGEDVLRVLHDKAPNVPAFVVTRSEEPDVFARCLRLKGADRAIPKRRLKRFPHEFTDYLYGEVSPLLHFLERSNHELAVRLVEAYRTWTAYPGILWHGEKTYHAVEHTLEHHLGLWRLANDLLPNHWDRIQAGRKAWARRSKQRPYTESDLFRFLMALWLHDIGCKGNERYQMADQVRHRHSWIGGDLIRRNPELYLLTRGEESEAVALLCEYHQSCAPFGNMRDCGEHVTGLFQQTLSDIEQNCRWPLMEWAALLRLLDAMELNWKRVGIERLSEAKRIAIQIDRRYYLENAAHNKESEEYAKWLGDQQNHMKLHLSVVDVRIKTKLAGDSKTVVFWPEYTFTNKDTARKFLPQIAWYVLKEWRDTGAYISDRMGMRLATCCDGLTNSEERIWAVWDFSEDEVYKDKKAEYESLKERIKSAEATLTEASASSDILELKEAIEELEKRAQEPWYVR